jgi:acyl-CoA synthetase (AMP-forming)/AMP-acid ligase II
VIDWLTLLDRGSLIEAGRVHRTDELREASRTLRDVVSVEAGDGYVAVVTSSAADTLAGVIGTLAAGRAVTPLADRPPGPTSAEQSLFQARLADLRPSAVLGDDGHATSLERAGYRRRGLSVVGSLRLWAAPDPVPPAHDEAAIVVYTSGSEGAPKGAVLTAHAVETILATNDHLLRWGAGDRLLIGLPQTHLAGLATALSAFAAGADVVVAPSFAFVDRVVDLVEAERPTVAGLVPYQVGRLFSTNRPHALSSLRLIVSSAAPLTPAVIRSVRRHRLHLDFINAYGLTEAFRSMTHRVGHADDTVLIGRPVPGVEAAIVGPRTGRRVPDGVEGELWIRGPHTFAGYVHRPFEQAKADAWVHTGDLAVVEPRGHRLTGRRRNLVNIAGEKTPIEAIEQVVDEAAPGAIAVSTCRNHRDQDCVVAVVERAARVSLDKIRRACSGHLVPSLRPRQVIVVDALPRLPSGKIDRTAVDALVDSALAGSATSTAARAEPEDGTEASRDDRSRA